MSIRDRRNEGAGWIEIGHPWDMMGTDEECG